MHTIATAFRDKAWATNRVKSTKNLTVADDLLYQRHMFAYRYAAITGHGDCLDIGCGFREGWENFERHGAIATVRGLDAEPKMAGDLVTCGDATDGMTFEAESFDTITAFQIVEHMKVPENLFRNIHKWLRPGGVAYVTTPNAAYRMIGRTVPFNKNHTQEFTAESFTNCLNGYGRRWSKVVLGGVTASPEVCGVEYRRIEGGVIRRGLRKVKDMIWRGDAIEGDFYFKPALVDVRALDLMLVLHK